MGSALHYQLHPNQCSYELYCFTDPGFKLAVLREAKVWEKIGTGIGTKMALAQWTWHLPLPRLSIMVILLF
jgi:hypothetical protein